MKKKSDLEMGHYLIKEIYFLSLPANDISMALKLIKVTPKKALNKAYLKVRPLRSEIDLFKANLITLLSKVNEVEREENQKNHIRDFLRDTYYKGINEINTKGTQDLVIHVDKTDQSKVGVIIEAKRPSNKSEWITADKINVKAVQELVLYYMRERVDEKNIDIKYLIATNIYEWYIFDAGYFDKVFYGNKKFVKQYEEWRDGKKVTRDTALFYNDIAKPFIDALEDEIPATYFDIRDYDKELRNEDKADDKKLIALQKLLSAYHLLRVPFANDSNELNNRFYKELLHIIGLEEVKDGGKQIIRRKSKDASEGSMIENTINILKTEDILVRLRNKQIFGETKDEQLYNIALELNLTWINRILFLKLLEGQLLSYHRNNKRYDFLNKDVVFDYDEIYKLFHQVLAKTMHDRTGNIVQKYQWVPYLNSSLFEISELENQTIKINSLDDHAHLEVMNGSILGQYKNQSINPLQYLFEFLDAYDFASEGVEEVQEDSRTLINASILGKIFEKINGYKDGSIYTPGFITMYMCRQAIRRAVVQKFKDAYGWNIHEFGDIRNYIADRRSKADILEFNALINSLRLCDPAVGSGHFLVSGLNEMVLIKYELGLLCDSEGSRITDYDLTIENDELIVTYSNGDIFEYQIIDGKPKSKEDQRLQKSLFHEKQTIIENCLFGVDINPNSVKICRLRLWIELLKNAYYKEDSGFTELETLPNIDINIKCGNSLISRYALDSDLSKALKSIKYNIDDYRAFVQSYKNCKDREEKRGLEEIINSIKNNFQSKIGMNDPIKKKLDQKLSELYHRFTGNFLFEPDEPYGSKKEQNDNDKEKLEAEIQKLSNELEEIKNNAVYLDAFEWRFEFPEVLNDIGDFIGFDVVVGNPPYIRQEELGLFKNHLQNRYKVYSSGGDIFSYFYELSHNILKMNGYFSFINNTFDKTTAGKTLREYVINNFKFIRYIDFTEVVVFAEATTYPIILVAEKSKSNGTFKYFKYDKSSFHDKELIKNESAYTEVLQDSLNSAAWNFINSFEQNILIKIQSNKSILDLYGKCYRGIITGLNEAFITEKSLGSYAILKDVYDGKDLKKWNTPSSFKKMIVFESKSTSKNFGKKTESEAEKTMKEKFPEIFTHLGPFKEKAEKRLDKGEYWWELRNCAYYNLFEQPKIIFPNLQNTNKFAYDLTRAYLNAPAVFLPSDDKALLAILNSKVIWHFLKSICVIRSGGYIEVKPQYFEQIPIPPIDEITKLKLTELAEEAIQEKIKNRNKDITALESQIDHLVYELYGLTEDEIKIIENG